MPRRETAPEGAPCWIDLFTSDPETSRRFYGELFGWTVEDPGPDYGGYVNFHKDGIPVAGCMGNDGSENPTNTWNVHLAVTDAAAACERATKAGGMVVVPPMPVMALGTMSVIIDLGGATIGAWQPGEHKGFGIYDEPDTPTWFELHTREFDKQLAFYRDVFGWDMHSVSDAPEFRYATYGEEPNAHAGIMDAANFLPAGVPSQWRVYFRTADTDKTLEQIADLGGTVLEPAEDTPYGRLATASDPTGAIFKLRAL